jgi:hypothetical protein
MRDGQAELPSAPELARLAQRLEPTFAAPVAKGGPLAAPLSKLLLGGLGVAGAALLALTLRAPRETSAVSAGVASVSGQPVPSLAPLVTSPAPAAAPASASAEEARPSQPAASGAVHAGKAPGKAAPSEAALLEQARAALASDPARALALTRQHQARFPSGVLKQEREVIAIEALRRLGQSKAAAERAGSFEQAYPDSAHRRAVESGLSK